MTITVDTHLDARDMERALRDDVERGLTATPKVLPPKWFYDDRGSQLFDEITRLPEYYPTRREREILDRRSDDIASASRADTLVELGSGTSTKTRLLLDAIRDAGRLRHFVPFDCSETTLCAAGESISATYPGVGVHAVVGDFERHLRLLPRVGQRRLVAFLGGTIGNLAPAERAKFLSELAGGLDDGDHLLLGTDLVKDRNRLIAAYDDSQGVTAEFNRNVLHVINRELDAGFVPDQFDHIARWNADEEWIEMRLRSGSLQLVDVRALDLQVGFGAGEEMRTEISAKFRRERVEAELDAAGFRITHWWTDRAGDFALSLSMRV
ncbi:MAG TPA: L-histidine N(alpha)-methyltransferase [Acidimicrobiales bacterium]|jgi:L-histidine N-alpha-methyltransferase|nr:L-histidine N(alpha)-methyltransferase [Acidimicrobiales bacterium]